MTTRTWTEWRVVCEPVDGNDGCNVGGLIVCLSDGDARREVTRVAFVREHSRHPDVSFEEQLRIELGKAEAAAGLVNELLDDLEAAHAEAIMRVRDRVREILGEPAAELA